MIIRSRRQHIDLSPVSGFFEKESFMNWVAVVDDEEVNRQIVCRVLKKSDYMVTAL